MPVSNSTNDVNPNPDRTVDSGVDENAKAFESLTRKVDVIRDRVESVYRGYTTGFFLSGRPGTAKSFTVMEQLKRLGTHYHYHSGHMTPLGMFDAIAAVHGPATIVLDDVAQMLEEQITVQLLLAALGRQANDTGERIVTYRRQGLVKTAKFSGGIIILTNLTLKKNSLTDAFSSRVLTYSYDPTDAELAALMRSVAAKGLYGISPEDCLKVAEFVIRESIELGLPLDMRVWHDKAMPDYHQWMLGHTRTDWQALVRGSLQQKLEDPGHERIRPKTRVDRKRQEYQLINQIHRKHSSVNERIAAWVKKTKKTPRSYYRRVNELTRLTQNPSNGTPIGD